MTLPRQILPGQFYLITRRTAQQQFLLRPDDEINNAFGYCLAEAAERFNMEIVLFQTMSNHYHDVVYDRLGVISEFTEHFHKMLAKCGNALRGRWENFWASTEVSIVHLVEVEDVIDKLVYTAVNPVEADLVEEVGDWPGVNGWNILLDQAPVTFQRPGHFFRKNGVMPETATLRFTIPPELGDREGVLSLLRSKVAAAEARCARRRAETGVRVLGRKGVLRTRWKDAPKGPAPRRTLRPRVAALNSDTRISALQRLAEFVRAYRAARAVWSTAAPIPFPPGTYWLRRHAPIQIATRLN